MIQRPHSPYWLLLLLVILVGMTFFFYADKRPNINDTIGYTMAAKRLAAGNGLAYADKHNATIAPYFTPYAFQIRRTDDARLFLGFPLGYPLLLAAGIVVTGSEAVGCPLRRVAVGAGGDRPYLYYGERSVLNYRRLPPPDPESGWYQTEVLEPCLRQVIGRLLNTGIPVYYVEDRSPPYWDSLTILQDNFSLALVQEAPNVYRVEMSAEDNAPQGGACPR